MIYSILSSEGDGCTYLRLSLKALWYLLQHLENQPQPTKDTPYKQTILSQERVDAWVNANPGSFEQEEESEYSRFYFRNPKKLIYPIAVRNILRDFFDFSETATIKELQVENVGLICIASTFEAIQAANYRYLDSFR